MSSVKNILSSKYFVIFVIILKLCVKSIFHIIKIHRNKLVIYRVSGNNTSLTLTIIPPF